MNNTQILRNLEYVVGGITAIKSLCNGEKDKNFKNVLDEWQDIIYGAIDLVEEEVNATDN